MPRKSSHPTPNPDSMNQAVAARQDSANPGSYRDRYRFNSETGQIERRDQAEAQTVWDHLQVVNEGHGRMSAMIPALATGEVRERYPAPPVQATGSGYVSMLPSQNYTLEWITGDPMMTTINTWGDNSDGKLDLRKGLFWWKRDALVYSCVALLTNLANAQLDIQCENEEFGTLVRNWTEKAMTFNFRQQWFMEFFRSFMVPTVKNLVPYVPREYKDNKIPQTKHGNVQAQAEQQAAQQEGRRASQEVTGQLVKAEAEAKEDYEKAMAAYLDAYFKKEHGNRVNALATKATAAQWRWQKGQIPAHYAIMDPLVIDLDGPQLMPWLRVPHMRVPADVLRAINAPMAGQKELAKQLPVEMLEQIRKGEHKFPLSPNFVTLAFGDKQDYEKYPIPMCVHAEEALELKYIMYAADKSTARSVRERVLKVTIGNDKYPCFDAGQMRHVSNQFQDPSRNLMVFWNHTLEVEWVEPKNTTFNDHAKYIHWNNEIRTAYGITSVATGGADGERQSGGSPVLSLQGLKARVEQAQQAFLHWYYAEVEMLKTALGMKYEVQASFPQINLSDPIQFMTMIMQAVQNGVLDMQTAIETMGFHWPTVKARMKIMKQLRDKGLFLPTPSANNMGPGGNIPDKGGQPTGGRPKGQVGPKNQQKVGKPQPKTKPGAGARARLTTDPEGNPVLVLDHSLGTDERKELAEFFTIAEGVITTAAEYKEKWGEDVDLGPPLPDLNLAEVAAAQSEAKQLKSKADEEAEAKIEEHKKSGTGKRGKYVTKTVQDETHAYFTDQTTGSCRPTEVAEAEWITAMDRATQEVGQAWPDQDALTTRILAAAILKKKYAKRKSTTQPEPKPLQKIDPGQPGNLSPLVTPAVEG